MAARCTGRATARSIAPHKAEARAVLPGASLGFVDRCGGGACSGEYLGRRAGHSIAPYPIRRRREMQPIIGHRVRKTVVRAITAFRSKNRTPWAAQKAAHSAFTAAIVQRD